MEDMPKRGAEEESGSESPPPEKLARTDPPFIRYLFTPAPNPNCVFLVGDESEEIHAENRFLMAHSEVFRLMLQDSALAERGHVRVEDIQPDAFKNLLRFSYGDKDLSYLAMEDAVDLMYVAEKYLVEELIFNLSTHISSMLTVENVCIPLQRPECYAQELLKDAINQKIQDFTDHILQSQDFLELNTFGLVIILRLDPLAVTEIELWRGVLKWAKHNAGSEDITYMRELLTEPFKHIRFCTLAVEDFCKEVFPTKLLLDHEVLTIITSIVSNSVLENLVSVCNSTQTRRVSVKKRVQFLTLTNCVYKCNKSSFSIVTNKSPITLLDALFECRDHSVLGETQNLQFQCECDVLVTRTDYARNDCEDSPVPELNFTFIQNVFFGNEFKIPFLVKGKSMKLSKYSKYTFFFQFKERFSYTSMKCFENCRVIFNKAFLQCRINKICCNIYNHKCNLVKQITYTLEK